MRGFSIQLPSLFVLVSSYAAPGRHFPWSPLGGILASIGDATIPKTRTYSVPHTLILSYIIIIGCFLFKMLFAKATRRFILSVLVLSLWESGPQHFSDNTMRNPADLACRPSAAQPVIRSGSATNHLSLGSLATDWVVEPVAPQEVVIRCLVDGDLVPSSAVAHVIEPSNSLCCGPFDAVGCPRDRARNDSRRDEDVLGLGRGGVPGAADGDSFDRAVLSRAGHHSWLVS